jgi:SEC-C motif-containing protein
MRSRYAAYACGDPDYLFRTWHPRTRPTDVTIVADTIWQGLDVTDTAGGGIDDDRGEVEFTAVFFNAAVHAAARPGSMHERSRFERRAGRWFYVDGVVES